MPIEHHKTPHGGVFDYSSQPSHDQLASEAGAENVTSAHTKGGEMTYRWRDPQTMVIDHTWVDPALRGQGVAKQLLDAAVGFARQHQLRIVPQCSYVALMFERDSSLNDLRA